ncbi:MAG: SUMF1/EgtB/PvdO family nonheme iron enzyme [Magnetococcales bacterium]|nr:SUMF1/EgtB/PvdO family nonheme iron enzyme [Magnetococcales bacterium]
MSSLLERYIFGRSGEMFPAHDVGVRVLDAWRADGPEWPNRMIHLVRRQLAVQRIMGQKMASSPMAGAKGIAAEVVRQTASLTRTIDEAARVMERHGLGTATLQAVTDSLVGLEAALCLELSESKWQMAQQNEAPDNILTVLCDDRVDEAQQLLQQGVMCYLQGAYVEAEAWFRSVLAYDEADYQALINLGYVALHRDDAEAAVRWFRQASELPSGLDDGAQALPLWALSRIYYAQADYGNACLFAQRAYAKSREVRHLFLAACYAALAGRWQEAWHGLEQAMRLDGRLLVRAAVEPLLEAAWEQVVPWLATLAQRHGQELSTAWQNLQQGAQRTLTLVRYPAAREALQRLVGEVKEMQNTQRGYADMVQRMASMPACQALLVQIGQYDEWLAEAERGSDEEGHIERLLRQISVEKMPWEQQRLQFGMRCPLTGMPFVWVPGGAFQMGDWLGDGNSHERPVHEVRLDGFWLGKYPVTQGDWKRVMGSNLSHFKRGGPYPVESISWDDVQSFIQRLNERGDGRYRLPTEAEWEYACCSGGKSEIYCGGGDLDAVAWHDGNSGERTHPVGRKRPNGLGLHDMSGNVWEWVWDRYDAQYYAHSPRYNPSGPAVGASRVKRGGAWNSSPDMMRSTFRFGSSPDGWYDDLGFRLVRESH